MLDSLSAKAWREIETAAWPWEHFTPKEMAERSEGWNQGLSPLSVNFRFMDRLARLRVSLGFPLVISSGYRSPAYNAKVSSTGSTGPHTTGRAVDIRIYGPRVVNLVTAAAGLGFTGFGIYQKGPLESRFIHLDDLDDGAGVPRPRIWSY